ncbi:MAG: hypothetical protein JW717_06645 [Marinilabiliaceae bacterium]|nr:hypothetical protein [Marinilabiliaceae bacterium]
MNFKSLALASAVVLGLSSCDKDVESTSLKLDDFSKAEVKIYAYADLDLSTVGLENAPTGTKLIISANYSDFNTNATGLYTDTITIGSNGIATTDLAVPTKGITYTITPVDFEANQTQITTSNASTVAKYWNATAKTVSLKPGQLDVVEITYEPSNYSDFVEMVSVTLYLNGEFNENLAGLETIPVSSITLIGTSGWSTIVTNLQNVTVDGNSYSKATVSVKKGEEISIVPFETLKTVVDNGVTTQKTYVYSALLGSFAKNEKGHSFNIGSGTEVIFPY